MRQHQTQRRRIDRTGEAHPQTCALDLKRSCLGYCSRTRSRIRRRFAPRCGQSCWASRGRLLNAKRNEQLAVTRRLSDRCPPPRLQQPAADTMATGQHGHVNPRPQALGNQCRLLRSAPSSASHNAGDDFYPTILVAFVPVLMHGIMASIFHRLTRATQHSRSLDRSSPRREGEALASVTPEAAISRGALRCMS
jgi:hypothetical protein